MFRRERVSSSGSLERGNSGAQGPHAAAAAGAGQSDAGPARGSPRPVLGDGDGDGANWDQGQYAQRPRAAAQAQAAAAAAAPPSTAASSRAASPLFSKPRRRATVVTQDDAVASLSAQQPQAAAQQPELHVLGEIVGASGFGTRTLFCSWQLLYDPSQWRLLRGQERGRTHVSGPADWDDHDTVWEYPISFVLVPRSYSKWPSLVVKVFRRSVLYGADQFVGYALARLPAAPGGHAVCSCPVWEPVQARQSLAQGLRRWFSGLAPQLVDEAFLIDTDKRFELGQGLHTQGAGRVTLRLHVLMRHADRLPMVVQCGGQQGGSNKHQGPARAVKAGKWPQQRGAGGWDEDSSGDDSGAGADNNESPGLRMVREGRAARLAGLPAPSTPPHAQAGVAPPAPLARAAAAAAAPRSSAGRPAWGAGV